MREANLGPTAISYDAGIRACAKGGQWEQVLSLLSEVEKAGLGTDVMTHAVVTSAFEEGGQWQRAAILLDEVLLKLGPERGN